MTNHQDWERLGRMLLAQRVRLGYPVRAKFAEANGLSHARTVSDIENAVVDKEAAGIVQVAGERWSALLAEGARFGRIFEEQ